MFSVTDIRPFSPNGEAPEEEEAPLLDFIGAQSGEPRNYESFLQDRFFINDDEREKKRLKVQHSPLVETSVIPVIPSQEVEDLTKIFSQLHIE